MPGDVSAFVVRRDGARLDPHATHLVARPAADGVQHLHQFGRVHQAQQRVVAVRLLGFLPEVLARDVEPFTAEAGGADVGELCVQLRLVGVVDAVERLRQNSERLGLLPLLPSGSLSPAPAGLEPGERLALEQARHDDELAAAEAPSA